MRKQTSASNQRFTQAIQTSKIGKTQGTLAPTKKSVKHWLPNFLRYEGEEKRVADMKANLKTLRAQRANGFRTEPGSASAPMTAANAQRARAEALALERSRKTKEPDIYGGQSQWHLDEFVRQTETAFRVKPITYEGTEAKCLYAGDYLAERPRVLWNSMDADIKVDAT